MNECKIVAFLQNPWFPDGTAPEVIDRYRSEQQFHQRLLARTMSGNRLMVAFGEFWFKRIWWDNANPEHSRRPGITTEYDIRHIERVIKEQEPHLILTFGTQARDGVSKSVASITTKVMSCHHPNARFRGQQDLDQFAEDVRAWALNWERTHVDD